MSRANGQTSEVVASFLFEEVLTDPEKAAIQDLIGVSPSGDVDAVVAEVAKRILYDPALDNVVGTDPDSLRTVATVDLPTNSIHAINLGSQLDFYRLRVGAPTGPSPEQVLPLDYATSGKYWKLHAVPRLPLVLSGVPEDGAFAIKAIGTVNFNNVPVDGDELIIDDRAYVWRDSPAISGDIPIGIDADASSVNLTTIIDDGDALNIPHATVSVYLPLAVTGTVLLQFNVAGTVGNSTPLSGDSVDLQYIPFNGGTEAVTGTPAEYIGQNAIFGSRVWFCSNLSPYAWVELVTEAALTPLVLDASPENAGEGLTITGTLTSNGSTPVVFPELLIDDEVFGKASFNDNPGGVSLNSCYWTGTEWELTYNGGDAIWHSSDDVATPDLCTTWIPQGAATGTPIITLPSGTPATFLGQDAIVNEESFYKNVRLSPVKWVGPFPA